ncbi:MAG: hypothetical protein HC771_13100 [Synechococcales cyanobacterium CRU_2_2]|nr:hypothetical protein [Synechococcales cyanobacterium CRU_2_2]
MAGWLAEDDAKEELVGTGQETLGDYLWSDLFLPGKIDRTEWSYDSKEQIRGIVKTVSMTRGEALGRLGSGLDWRLVDERTILNDMTLVERQEETWISHGPRDWEVKTRKRTARALHSNNASNLTSRFQAVEELFDAAVINLNEKKSFYSALIAEALDMIDVQPDQNPDRKTDGSLTPPETQRKPARFYAEPGQIKITSGLPLNNPQGEIRRDSTTIPYLPDANGDAVAGSGAQVDRAGIWALKRAYLAACRFHGKRIRAAIPNSMLSEFAPFKCFDVSADGQTYRLALDGVTWTFTRTACYFEADAPLLMSGPTGGTLELPYNKPQF